MRSLPAIASLAFLIAVFPFVARAQEQPAWEIQALNQIVPGAPEGSVEYDAATGTARGTNVQIWVGEHIRYNFKTHQMQSEQFRMGKPPVFAAGNELQGDISNKTYTARHVLVTTDDISKPAIRVRASRVKIVPGKYVEMWNAVVIMDGVPVFYFPYYHRNLGEHANNLNFMVGDSSAYGPFLLNTYDWYLNDVLDGRIHLDYRERRGMGVGPDLNLHLGRWGDATLKYYYLHDQEPNQSTNNLPFFGTIPKNRQRLYFAYQATPFTNLNVKALVNYQSDPLVLHDFFEGDYTGNPQPNTFIEVNKYWENWSLDAETTPRINGFFDQVERLPDVKLTGFRQQIFNTPVYYESESSAGYYRKFFANTNSPLNNTNLDYSGARADTFHQVLLPETFFGWLNVTPRAGGRFTYYSEENGPGGTNGEAYREVFNTGAEVSFKASHLWTGATNSILDVDGLRHVIEPSVNYVFVPHPSTPPSRLPQFDSELPSLQLLPIQFPDYNDIDSIDSQNVIRFGLRNTLQTKRDGQLDNLLDWNVMLDWRLDPKAGQQTFNDLCSDFAFRPRTWITLESQLRYDINSSDLNLAFHQLTFTPNEKWSWGIGHWYLRGGFLGNDVGGANFVSSTMFFRLNDNWGLRATHSFSAQNGRLQEQFYTIYRDLRSWTGALTFRVTDNGNGSKDFTVAFTFSLKAHPHYHPGDDTVDPYHLVGE
ncbi:MAG: LPS assembly protein LptD [Verrucomicrobiota bacterium]